MNSAPREHRGAAFRLHAALSRGGTRKNFTQPRVQTDGWCLGSVKHDPARIGVIPRRAQRVRP
jgi:hypothetical protein